MELYQPTQNLTFVYYAATRALFIGSDLEVLIDRHEGMGFSVIFPSGTALASLTLQVTSDPSSGTQKLITHRVLCSISALVPPIPYDPYTQPDKFKDALRVFIGQDLQSRQAGEYTVTAKVVKLDGSTGGQGSSTISSNGTIEII